MSKIASIHPWLVLMLVMVATCLGLGQIGGNKIPKEVSRPATPELDSKGQLTTTVIDSRPLAQAADLVALKLDVSASYEDPAWVWKEDLAYAAELPDNSSLAVKNPDWKGPIVPRGGIVDVTLPFAQQDRLLVDPKTILQSILNSYGARGNTAQFKIVQYGVRKFSFVPEMARDVSGKMVQQHSPFDVVISLPEVDRSVGETIVAIFKAISEKGNYRLSNGPMLSPKSFSIERIKMGATNEIARNALDRAFSSVGRVSWNLNFDPGSASYAFNIR